MLKHLLATGLLLIYLAPLLVKVFIIIDFKIHQERIARELCIEKDVPDSSCKGKCQLEKRLQEAEENNTPEWPESISYKTEQHFVPASFQLMNKQSAHLNKRLILFRNEPICCSGFLNGIFKPPRTLTSTLSYGHSA